MRSPEKEFPYLSFLVQEDKTTSKWKLSISFLRPFSTQRLLLSNKSSLASNDVKFENFSTQCHVDDIANADSKDQSLMPSVATLPPPDNLSRNRYVPQPFYDFSETLLRHRTYKEWPEQAEPDCEFIERTHIVFFTVQVIKLLHK